LEPTPPGTVAAGHLVEWTEQVDVEPSVFQTSMLQYCIGATVAARAPDFASPRVLQSSIVDRAPTHEWPLSDAVFSLHFSVWKAMTCVFSRHCCFFSWDRAIGRGCLVDAVLVSEWIC